MVFVNPLTNSGTYRSIKLESKRKGDIQNAIDQLSIIFVNPKKKTYMVISKLSNKENIPKDLKVPRDASRSFPRSTAQLTKEKAISQPTTNVNIAPPPAFPPQYGMRVDPTPPTFIQQPINKDIPQPIPTYNNNNSRSNIILPSERLIPKYDNIAPRYIGINIRDIIFQISRLRYLIRHFDGIITDPSERILLENFKSNYAQLSKSQNIKSIQYYLQKILLELNALLKFRNPNENLDMQIQKLNNSDPLEQKIKSLIDEVLDKFYSSINVEDANTSDFTQQDLFTLFTNFDLRKYPLIYNFLMENARTYNEAFIETLNLLSNQPHAPTDLNTQFQLISFFILKYGLNFPTQLFTFFLNLIKSDLNTYKDVILRYINNNPWDQATYNLAVQNLGITLENPNMASSRYESDILNNQQPSTSGAFLRTAQDIIQPVKNISQRVLTHAWRNPAQTAIKLTTTGAVMKSMYDYATGDYGTATDLGLYTAQRAFEDGLAERAVQNVPTEYKNLFRPLAKYGAHKLYEGGQATVNTAIPVVQGVQQSITEVGNQINDATRAINSFGQSVRRYIPFTGEPIQTATIEEYQLPSEPVRPTTRPESPEIFSESVENWEFTPRGVATPQNEAPILNSDYDEL